MNPDAQPKAVHVPSKVPLHWEEKVKQQILDNVALGVLEPVHHGQPLNGAIEWWLQGKVMEVHGELSIWQR